MCSTYEDFSEVVFAGDQAVQPVGERRDEYSIWSALGTRLGQQEYWQWKDYREVIDYQLKPLGITYEQMIERRFHKVR